MILLSSFHLATRLNSEKINETDINEIWHINIFMNIGISDGHNKFEPHVNVVFDFFRSLQDFWPPSTWNSLVHISCGEMERCETRAFQLFKMRKKKISWNIKTKCVTDFLLTVSSSSMKDYTFHYVVIT